MLRAIFWLAIVFAVLIFGGCASTYGALKPRICNGRIGVQISENVSAETEEAVSRAIRYWNTELGHQVFFRSRRGTLLIEQDRINDMGTFRPVYDGGCLVAGIITISEKVLEMAVEKIDLVVRHEFGHALGLPDEPGVTVMMPRFPKGDHVFSSWPKIPEASPRELLQLYTLYGHPNDYFVPGVVPAS